MEDNHPILSAQGGAVPWFSWSITVPPPFSRRHLTVLQLRLYCNCGWGRALAVVHAVEWCLLPDLPLTLRFSAYRLAISDTLLSLYVCAHG